MLVTRAQLNSANIQSELLQISTFLGCQLVKLHR